MGLAEPLGITPADSGGASPAAALGGTRLSLLAPLRGGDFRLFWSGTILSLAGDQLSFVALAWLTLQLTRSPLATGGVLAAAAVPRGALGLLGGAVSDRFGARRLGVLTTLVRALGMGLLAGLALSGKAQIAEIYVIAAAFGTADAFYGPSRGSLLPLTVAVEQLEAATGLENAAQSLVSLLGPAVAGILIAKAGTGYAFAADAVAYLGVALLTAQLRVGGARATAGGQDPAGLLSETAAGLRYALGDPVVRTLILIVLAMTFAISGPEAVGFPVLARLRWGGPVALGLTLGAFGGGSLIGSLLAGALPQGRVLRRLVGVAVVFAFGLALIGVAPNVYVAMALTAAMGVGAGLINVIGSSWMMRRTPPELMGRVVSVIMVTQVAASPLSMAATGVVAQLNPTAVYIGAGAVMLAAAIAALTSRTVRETP